MIGKICLFAPAAGSAPEPYLPLTDGCTAGQSRAVEAVMPTLLFRIPETSGFQNRPFATGGRLKQARAVGDTVVQVRYSIERTYEGNFKSLWK